MWNNEGLDQFVEGYVKEKNAQDSDINVENNNNELNIKENETNPQSERKNKLEQSESKVNLSAVKNSEQQHSAVKNVDQTPRKNRPLIIDLEKLSENNKPLENSEVLLAIFEVTTNSENYGITQSNKSRSFWDKLGSVKSFNKILLSFKSETLRKYWRLLSEIPQKKVLDIIRRNIEPINNTFMKLLTIITLLKDYSGGKISDLKKMLEDHPEKASHINKSGVYEKRVRGNDDEESFDIDEGKKWRTETKKSNSLLNTKRRNADEELINEMTKKIEMVNGALDSGVENNILNVVGKRSTRNKGQSILFSEDDKRIFGEIEVIVSTLKNWVPEAAEFEIWDALKRNSFNIINTYLYLVEPEIYDGKINIFNLNFLII
jgi:hypothetical protein